MATKTCKRCGSEKERELFPKLGAVCKACQVVWQTEYRRRKRELNPKPPKLVITHKICTMCGVDKPLEQYNFANRAKNIRSSYCKPCQGKRSYADSLRRGNREYEAIRYRCNKYELPPEWYVVTLSKQDGKCALCSKAEHHPIRKGGKPRSLAIDHDHATGRPRGLLCFRCNTALHQLETHGYAWADRAIEYLKKHQET